MFRTQNMGSKFEKGGVGEGVADETSFFVRGRFRFHDQFLRLALVIRRVFQLTI